MRKVRKEERFCHYSLRRGKQVTKDGVTGPNEIKDSAAVKK